MQKYSNVLHPKICIPSNPFIAPQLHPYEMGFGDFMLLPLRVKDKICKTNLRLYLILSHFTAVRGKLMVLFFNAN